MIRRYWVVIGGVIWVSTAWAGPDEDAVERVLLAEAKSSATFAETRDTQAVLKLYTSDYNGVQDGEAETRESIEKWLAEYGSALDQGSRVHFLGTVSNVKIAPKRSRRAWNGNGCHERSRLTHRGVRVVPRGLRPCDAT